MDFILLESTILICIIVVYIVFSSFKSSKAIMQVTFYIFQLLVWTLQTAKVVKDQSNEESTLSSWNTQKLKPFWLHDRFQAAKESHKPKHSKGKTMWHGEKRNEVLLNFEWTWNMKRNANATLNYCRKESVCQVFKMIL